jgi:hypothetical protein
LKYILFVNNAGAKQARVCCPWQAFTNLIIASNALDYMIEALFLRFTLEKALGLIPQTLD